MNIKNPKSIETRRCLTQALLIIMKKKNIQDITISELCSKAGVSRTGFYRNFNYKEDLIYEHMKFIYSEYTNCLTSKKNLSSFEASESFFRYFLQYKDFLSSLIRSNIQTLLLDIFVENLKDMENLLGINKGQEIDNLLHRQFTAGGLYQLLITWVKNNCEPDIKVMAKAVENINAYKL
ncbi:hypothetical protein DS885_15820 [Psychromonas sp. B3M02]|uniref:TetR/AcrR family transcriptional regulator n=1 Tax=Psychromonas sp. B3M02 TaxID=2267226 RepID=UPI000DEBBE11|nr:TetR/AcrR family transcriptional regulator [Psychromonas sp. B3M02]RBW41683.1 hypothetical protein DS885_15820 [Psychromonas sp. B3M02]